MAFEAGIANGQKDLLDRLEAFLTPLADWSIAFSIDNTASGGERLLCVSFSDGATPVYCTYETDLDYTYERLKSQISLSYDSTKDALNQPQSPRTEANSTHLAFISIPKTAQFNYWFFAGPEHLHIVCGMGDWFQHLYFGKLSTRGGYPNGYFLSGCWVMAYYGNTSTDYNTTSTSYRAHPLGRSVAYGSGWVRYKDSTWQRMNYNSTTSPGINSNLSLNTNFPHYLELQYARSHPNAPVPVLLPVLFWDLDKVPVGYIPDAYFVLVDTLNAGQEISLGADTYVVFPWWNKNYSWSTSWYANLGVAIRKVV